MCACMCECVCDINVEWRQRRKEHEAGKRREQYNRYDMNAEGRCAETVVNDMSTLVGFFFSVCSVFLSTLAQRRVILERGSLIEKMSCTNTINVGKPRSLWAVLLPPGWRSLIGFCLK